MQANIACAIQYSAKNWNSADSLVIALRYDGRV